MAAGRCVQFTTVPFFPSVLKVQCSRYCALVKELFVFVAGFK